MKKFLLSFMLVLAATAASAQTEFVVGNFTYRVLDVNSVALARVPMETEGMVEIPPTVSYGGTSYTVTTINAPETDGAFYGCANVTGITIPATVTTIDGWLAYDANNCVDVIFADGDTPVTYTNPQTEWVPFDYLYLGRDIVRQNPENADCFFLYVKRVEVGPKVTTIPNRLFLNNGYLESVDMSNATSLTTIGEEAFCSCSGLSSVDIPNSVTTIGRYAFAYCYNLQDVTLSDHLKAIDEYTFYNCNSLGSLTIPVSVETFDASALESIYSDKPFALTIEDSKNPLIVKRGGSCAIDGPSEVSLYIGRTLKRAAKTSEDEDTYDDDPFFGNNLTYVEFGANVTDIPSYFFKGCQNLTTITFDPSSSLVSIGDYAFQDCGRLEGFHAPSSLRTIGVEAFENCFALATVTLNSGLEVISNGAFYDTDALTDITIPASVKTIGRAPFYSHGGHKMKIMIIEDSDTPLEYINDDPEYAWGNGRITDDVVLDYFYLGRDITPTSPGSPLIYGAKQVEIGEKVTTIYDAAFRDCTATEEFIGMSNVSSIGNQAFYCCENATFPDDLGIKLTSLGGGAFVKCEKLRKITLPGTLKVIPEPYYDWGTFEKCYSLEDLIIEEGVEEIGSGAFYDCGSLETIILPSTLKKIGRSPFFCANTESHLRELIIADSPTALEYNNANTDGNWGYGDPELSSQTTLERLYLGRDVRIENDYNLVTKAKLIEIGANVTTLAGLFTDTEEVVEVKEHAPKPIAISSETFAQETYDGLLNVPGGTREAYGEAEGWKLFKNMDFWSTLVTLTATGQGDLSCDDVTARNGNQEYRLPKYDAITVATAADAGYQLTSLTVDGAAVTPADTYTRANSGDEYAAFAATWTPITYTIGYNLAGGSLPDGKTNPTNYTIESADITLNNPTRTGYDFAGWTGTDLAEAMKAVTIAKGSIGARSYTATWNRKVYNVDITATGGGNVTASTLKPLYEDNVVLTISGTTNELLLETLTVNGKDVTADVKDNQYTVKNISANVTVEATFIVVVGIDGTVAALANMPVYDLRGRKVADTFCPAQLKKGVYIVGGKKVMVGRQ